MGASPAVTAAADTYVSVRLLSIPAIFINFAVLGWLIGQARTMTGLVLQIVINVGNMALTVLFVSGLERGIAGAATANALAEWIGAAVGLVVVMASLGWRFAVPWAVILDRARLIQTFAINRDIMIRTAALLASLAFFTRQGAVGGDTVLAANAILMNFVGIVAFFLDGFATSAEQLGGQAVGARDEASFRRAVWLSSIWAIAFGTVASAVFFVGGGAAIDFVSTSEAVRAEAKRYLPYMALTPSRGSWPSSSTASSSARPGRSPCATACSPRSRPSSRRGGSCPASAMTGCGSPISSCRRCAASISASPCPA